MTWNDNLQNIYFFDIYTNKLQYNTKKFTIAEKVKKRTKFNHYICN